MNKYLEKIAVFNLNGVKKVVKVLKGNNVIATDHSAFKAKIIAENLDKKLKMRKVIHPSGDPKINSANKAFKKMDDLQKTHFSNIGTEISRTENYRGTAGAVVGAGLGAYAGGPNHRVSGAFVGGTTGGLGAAILGRKHIIDKLDKVREVRKAKFGHE